MRDDAEHGRSRVLMIDCVWVRGERLITCAYTTEQFILYPLVHTTSRGDYFSMEPNSILRPG